MFVNGPGDLGSIPDRVIPKTLKMVLDTSLLNTQQYKLRIEGNVEHSWERISCYWKKGAFWLPSTTVANFTYLYYLDSSADLSFPHSLFCAFLRYCILSDFFFFIFGQLSSSFLNVSADMFSGLPQVFVELGNLHGNSNYVIYWIHAGHLFWFR